VVVLGRQRHAETLHACEDESGRSFEVCEYFLEMEDTSRDGGRFRGHFGREDSQVEAERGWRHEISGVASVRFGGCWPRPDFLAAC